jgi:hypothetical protein
VQVHLDGVLDDEARHCSAPTTECTISLSQLWRPAFRASGSPFSAPSSLLPYLFLCRLGCVDTRGWVLFSQPRVQRAYGHAPTLNLSSTHSGGGRWTARHAAGCLCCSMRPLDG